MRLTRAQRDILWADFRADDSGRATALGHWFAVLSRYRRRWLCDTCETRRSECSCD